MGLSILRLNTILLLAVMCHAHAAQPQNPLLVGDAIYVSKQGIHRFNQNQQKPLWSSLVGVETYAPVVFENLLLVGSTQGLYALDTESGRVNWQIEKQRTLFSPVISGQAFAGSLHGELYAINPQTGSISWRRQFPGWIYSPAVFEDSGRLVTGGQAHQIYLLFTISGELLHEIPTSQESVFSPVNLGNNRAGVNLFDGTTVVLQVDSGEVVGMLDGDSQPSNLQRKGDAIYRSHRDGSLSAFNHKNLKLNWRRALVSRELSLHPSLQGYLLLSDLDQNLILIELQQSSEICRFQVAGRWHSPIQIDTGKIVYFRILMQPLQNMPVELDAQCK